MELAATSKYQDKSTLWGSVSIEYLRATPVWKHYQDETGRIPHAMYKNVMKAVLYYLGMDIDNDHGFTQQKGFIRDQRDATKGIKTLIYTFPVRKDYRYKDIYLNSDILSGKAQDNIRGYNLSDYGTQYWCEGEHQRNKKKQTREQILDSIIAGGIPV